MSDTKKSIAQRLQETSLSAKDAATRGAQALGDGVQRGGEAFAQGAQALGDGVQKGGEAVAQGAQLVGRGVKKGGQMVKEHPKETAIIVGATIVAAGALPIIPWTAPAAIAAITAVGAGAKATEDVWRNCGLEKQPTDEQTTDE
jgi:hypothetical protein